MGMDDDAAREEEMIAEIEAASRARWEAQLKEALEAAKEAKDADDAGEQVESTGESVSVEE